MLWRSSRGRPLNSPAESSDSPTADDFRAVYSVAEWPVPREDIVGQPPNIVRTNYTGHKVRSSTDLAGWAFTASAIYIGLIIIIAEMRFWRELRSSRAAATRMADIGVQPHIIEAVLNHVSGHKAGVAGIYNRSTYATEKRDALERWANHLRVILAQAEGANVVKLQKTTA
jgi:ABC-type branched-subunit amino acid transport system permease subunit